MTNYQAEARRIAEYQNIKRVIYYTGIGAGKRKFHTEAEFKNVLNRLGKNKNHASLVKKIKTFSLPKQLRFVGGILFVKKV
tara:strand:+ start:924 stop:1166 length:243 start_codon:yes stop_codon:yes gene_type:complete